MKCNISNVLFLFNLELTDHCYGPMVAVTFIVRAHLLSGATGGTWDARDQCFCEGCKGRRCRCAWGYMAA